MQRGLGRVKALLKVVSSPTDDMAKTFRALFQQGPAEAFPLSVGGPSQQGGDGYFRTERDLLALLCEMKARTAAARSPLSCSSAPSTLTSAPSL